MRVLVLALLIGWAPPAAAEERPTSCNLAAPVLAEAGAGCERGWIDRNLRVNDMLTVGTHNSYKTGLPDAVLALIRARLPVVADELDYRHRALSEQLDAGARQLEIDIYYDPQGGRFADPAGLRAAGIRQDPVRQAEWGEPGFKVMHVQDIDVMSTCINLRDCLSTIRGWSLAHPDHVPILLMFNAKSDRAAFPGGVDALPFDSAAFDALDREVRAVFPRQAMIVPDDVQGGYPTLREAVLHNNWPTLGQARGKVLFALDEDPAKVEVYRGSRRSLEGRVFFVNTEETSPAAAYLTLNDPMADGARIRAAVNQGFLVRTRADAGTQEARRDDVSRRDAAFASGAQFVSTDYLWADDRLGNGYQIRLANRAAAVCNPIRAASRCEAEALERVVEQAAPYVSPEAMPDGLRILPPPPRRGSALGRADRAVFKATRALAGNARWKLAKADVDSGAFEHFACALGITLSPQLAPRLAALLDKVGTASVVDPVKHFYRIGRPYLRTAAPICQPRTAHLAANGDYPSGHTAGGWLEALLLAELFPDRGTAILTRGRAYGESRAICGAHSLSAVEAGWLAGSAAYAALHGSAPFRADIELVRREVAAIRSQAPVTSAALCRAEAKALRTMTWRQARY